jgi:hypothetical protein
MKITRFFALGVGIPMTAYMIFALAFGKPDNILEPVILFLISFSMLLWGFDGVVGGEMYDTTH